MMRSLFSGVSGLKGHQTRMDVIGNNIANVNTTGFKSGRLTFQDTLSQTTSAASAPSQNLGGTNPKQIGLGAGVATIDTVFTDGSIQSTGKNTDLCISGNGLFVVKNGNQEYYTRNGAFAFDESGNFIMPGSGMKVQGYMAVNGDLSGASGTPEDIIVKEGQVMEAVATTSATFTKNLRADMPGYDINSIIVNYADGTQETVTSYSPTQVNSATIRLTTTGSGDIDVDDTAGFNFTTGQALTGLKLWTKKIESVEASTTATVDLDISKGSNSPNIISTSPLSITGLTSGTYAVDGSFALSGVIEPNGVTAVGPASNPNSVLQITFKLDSSFGTSAGNTVTVQVPNPNNSTTYSDGDTVKFSGFKIDSLTAASGAKINCADGRTDVLQSSLNVTSATQTYSRIGQASDGTIQSITRIGGETSYQVNGKTVSSLDIVTDKGNFPGLLGHAYNASDTFYSSISPTVKVYDSDSGVHNIPVLFTRVSGKESTWELTLKGGGDSYSIVEDDGTTMTVSLEKNAEGLIFNENGRYVNGTGTLHITYSGDRAVDNATIALNLSALTQLVDESTISADSNGNAYGVLNNIAIDSTGVITGIYTNGEKRSEAKVAIATFTNVSGLTKTGVSLYQESNNSGAVSYDSTGCTITSSALEMSNVDIANEFADMIVTQRGFQSNSKIITVGDEMLETLINMKR